MSYLVLARKYRPAGFDDFVGQQVISDTLRNAIRYDRVAHAYLFCGPRGVGKTSMARVFAKALNCAKGPTPEPCGTCERCVSITTGQDVDVIEIDGASNRGIDEVREIRQNVRYAASRSRFKIYYIDEVHMLTEHAFNALLKTLEEPPAHVKFILATTAPARLPETILSRVQRFDFRRISNADISSALKAICKKEKMKAAEDVLLLLARRARGSMRDALSLLDQVSSFCGERLDVDKVGHLLGTLSDDELAHVLKGIRENDGAKLLQTAGDLLARGMAVGEVLDQITAYLRDLLVGRICGADQDLLDRPAESAAAVVEAGKDMAPEHLLYMIQLLTDSRRRLREAYDDRIVLETTLVKLAETDTVAPLGEMIERLTALEESLRGSGVEPANPALTARAASEKTEQSRRPEENSPPATPPPRAAGEIEDDAGKREEIWRSVLRAARKRESWLYVNLAIGHLQRVGDGEVVIAFPAENPTARDQFERREHRKALEDVLEEVLSRPVKLHLVTVSGTSAGEMPEEAAARDPMIQEALRTFDGRIISGYS